MEKIEKAVLCMNANCLGYNGADIYSFEYFYFLWEIDNDIRFIIIGDDTHYNILIDTIKNRYDLDASVFDSIIHVQSVYKLIRYRIKYPLIFAKYYVNQMELGLCGSTKIFIYCNDKGIISTKLPNRIYGYYDYQTFDVRTPLKFYWEIYKTIDQCDNATMVGVDRGSKISNKYTESTKLFSREYDSTANVFGRYDTFIYAMNKFDRNNRLIPESLFYNKNVIYDVDKPHDSAWFRYNDIVNGNMDKYTLKFSDILIQEYLNEL